jgi:hypothetical protein
MKIQVGDLVRIMHGWTDQDDDEFDWIGMILSYRGRGGMDDEYDEWVVQWAHQPQEAIEYGYYLEVI